MTQTEKRKRKTDQAWDQLHGRLEEEDLLAGTSKRSSYRLTLFKWASAAAAVVIFCIYLSVGHFTTKEDNWDDLPLTKANNETTTLVTTLEDGSIVYLAGKTFLHYPEHFSPDTRKVALEGNARFDITGNRKHPFIIETKETQIEVLGTAFHIKSDANTPFELTVQRGEVKVTLKKSGQNLHVKAGETATLLSRKLQLNPTSDPGQFTRYTERFRFKDESLDNILRVINLNESGIRMEASPALKNRSLTVSFSNNSPEVIAELICLALHVKCSRENNVLTFSE